MELNIIKIIKQLRQQLRHKPMLMVEKQKKIKPTKSNKKPTKSNKKPTKSKREQIKAVVNGKELTLSRIAQIYNLKPHTVYARYRVGNRGKLLIRPAQRKNLT